MRAPVKRLLKREVEWLGTHMCKHSHTYLEHYNCFITDYPEGIEGIISLPEKIGLLDIETTNLKSNWGYIFCYFIKHYGKDKYESYVVKQSDIRSGEQDKKLLKKLCEDIKKFDRIVVYYGKDRRHDIPFIRSRATKYGFDFPIYRSMYVTDVYDICKAKLSLHRYRMATACQFFGIPAKEHRLNPDIWNRALAGDVKSLEHIAKHCKEDVDSLDLLTQKLIKFVRISKTSI